VLFFLKYVFLLSLTIISYAQPVLTIKENAIPSISISEERSLDRKILHKLASFNMNGDPASHLNIPDIHTSRIAQLGRELFFTTDLSGDKDVACVSCHHPALGGADALSLPVGVGAIDPNVIGLGRAHNGETTQDSRADGGPNVERNSPTTFNIALYQQSMFFDGRVQLISNKNSPNHSLINNNKSNDIRTPDSIFESPDTLAGRNIVEAQARFPLVSLTEMRGVKQFIGYDNERVRQEIVNRLSLDNRGVNAFENAFVNHAEIKNNGSYKPKSDNPPPIDFSKIAQALSEYQRSQVFVNNPWKSYVAGNGNISVDAKLGAKLFFTAVENDGAGCFKCHSGDFYTDEKFYNLAVPQIGRGKLSYGRDIGRYAVSRDINDRYAFRTPTLLNVTETAPYGHTGVFNTLEEIIKHHAEPSQSIQTFDFTLKHLPQFSNINATYPSAKENTLNALAQYEININKEKNEKLRSNQNLTDHQISHLVSFLETLTDPCILDIKCLSPWMSSNSEFSNTQLSIKLSPGIQPKEKILIDTQSEKKLVSINKSIRKSSVIDLTCQKMNSSKNDNQFQFQAKSLIASESNKHVFSNAALQNSMRSINKLLNTGSMATGDINGDCYSDLILTQGDVSPIQIYINDTNGGFILSDDSFGLKNVNITAGITLVDLNGDGWLDLFSGDIYGFEPKIFINNAKGKFERSSDTGFLVTHATVGAAFGDIDNDGDMDAFLAHWDLIKGPEEDHLWLNDGTGKFSSAAKEYGLVNQFGYRDFTFTSNFADINKDGKQDILVAADFTQSQYFINKNNKLVNLTAKSDLSDENGMGATLLDFDNDQDLDWFVTSIYNEDAITNGKRARGIWGVSGNRLFVNSLNEDGDTVFENAFPHTPTDLKSMPKHKNLANGGWGWGACSADFNNDGWADIYHVNGYSVDPNSLRLDLLSALKTLGLEDYSDVYKHRTETDFRRALNKKIKLDSLMKLQKNKISELYEFSKTIKSLNQTKELFGKNESRLFINQKNGQFEEMAKSVGVNDSGQGRGVSCFDYDRDGDIDIFIFNNMGSVSFYENKLGAGSTTTNFINIKLLDQSPNVHAIGAKITLETDDTTQYKEVRIENNYLSQNPLESHFGLGSNKRINKISIIWPDGSTQEIINPEINRMHLIKKGATFPQQISDASK
jgi:cytochrome c peroxidase